MAVLDRVDGVAAISPSDAEHFIAHGTETPIVTIPFGSGTGRIMNGRTAQHRHKPVFFHLGSMDWLPNEEGVRWLLDLRLAQGAEEATRSTLELGRQQDAEGSAGTKNKGVL